MDWLKCNICFNTYNDFSLRPRSLSCGHTFCEKCLDNTIQNKTLTCPQCRKILEINSVVDLPVNFVLEGLLKSLNPCLQDVSEGAISRPIEGECFPDDKSETDISLKSILEQQQKSLSVQKELLKTSAGMCNEHSCNELIFRCSSHNSWVCEKCIEERGDHSKPDCRITSFKEEIENRKQEYKISLDNEEKTCDETILVINKHIFNLSEKREHHISLVEALQDLVNLHKNEDTNLQSEITSFEKIIENGRSVKQRLQDAKTTILNTETLDESNAARDMVENKKSDARDWVKNSDREVDEGNLKVQTSTHLEMATKSSLDYREKCGLLQEELDTNINQSEQNEPLENRMNSKEIEFTEKNESRTSEVAYDEICKAHHKTIGHRCLKCHRWICVDCLTFHTSVTGCSTINASTAVKNMKDEHTESLDVILSNFEKDTNYLFSEIQKHNYEIQEITAEKKELSEQVEEHAEEINKIQNLLKQGEQLKENVVESHNYLNATESPHAVIDRIEVLAEMRQALYSWSITMGIPHNINDIAKALKEDKNLYVECVIKDEKRYGKLSLDDGYIFSHKFSTQNVEDGSILVPFDRLQKLLPLCPTMVFMELSLGGVVKGRIVVRLNKNLPNIRENMINILSGQLGKTLAGIRCDQNSYNALWITSLPFKDLRVTLDSSATPVSKRGDVVGFYGNRYLQQILFHVGAHSWNNDDLKSLGSIVSGLDIVQECYDNHSSGVLITDCGLVLPQEE